MYFGLFFGVDVDCVVVDGVVLLYLVVLYFDVELEWFGKFGVWDYFVVCRDLCLGGVGVGLFSGGLVVELLVGVVVGGYGFVVNCGYFCFYL